MTKIDHIKNEAGGKFSVATAHGSAALDYETGPGGEMVIMRTYVPPAARGRKLAETLVEAAVAAARAKGVRVDPECSFAARLFDRRAEWADLRARHAAR